MSRKRLENQLENLCIRYARERGWFVLPKFETNGGTGVPDRLFIKESRTVFIEFKVFGGVLSKQQEFWGEQLKSQGVEWYVCFTFQEFMDILNLKNGCSGGRQIEQIVCPCCGSNRTYRTEAIHCDICAVISEI